MNIGGEILLGLIVLAGVVFLVTLLSDISESYRLRDEEDRRNGRRSGR